MTKNEYKNLIIQRVRKVTADFMPDAEVYLYGSRARGDARSDSDWDFVVLFDLPRLSFDVETQYMDALYEVSLETGAVLSPLIYTKEQWQQRKNSSPLFRNVLSEGIQLV